ncbi:MAG: hypothetical protein OIN88_10445 [Candidatus Methanoperedens sp.]|nr:hypothetical protein [Candidatus Methanoperedens sp.]
MFPSIMCTARYCSQVRRPIRDAAAQETARMGVGRTDWGIDDNFLWK